MSQQELSSVRSRTSRRADVLWTLVPLLGWLLLTSAAPQSALRTFGPQSERIGNLWWVFFWILAVVYVVTMALVMIALWKSVVRRKESTQGDTPLETSLFIPNFEKARKSRLTRTVSVGVGITTLVLLGLLISTYATGSKMTEYPKNNPLYVEVNGHQWWWEFRYVDTLAENRVTTANELHIPVGRPVVLHLTSHDVIHSFWVPNLHGKRDLIPGYKTDLWFQADKPGTYRGECAEFCGYQHAKMGFLVVADPPAEFAKWFENAKQPAREPLDSMAKRGKEVFMALPCSNCHTIGGTPAGGHVAPDLTHVGSRFTLAAATVPNKRAHLTAWVLDPQSIKPGNKMPQNVIDPRDLRALVSYLESLK